MINESTMNLFPSEWKKNEQEGIADLTTNLSGQWQTALQFPVGVNFRHTKTYLSFVASYNNNDKGVSTASTEKVLKVSVKKGETIRAEREITLGEFDKGQVVNVPFEFLEKSEGLSVVIENLKGTELQGSLYGCLKFGFDAV